MALKNDGACDQATPLLQRLAARGQGFEIAQYHLGDCLLVMSNQAESQSVTAVREAHGLYWLLKAAHSNNADAQGRLAGVYLSDHVVPQNRVEAAKWYLLYMRNPIQVKVGAMPLEKGVERYLLDELRPQEWAAATLQADTWVAVKQEINRAADGRPQRDGPAEREAPPRRLSENTVPNIQG